MITSQNSETAELSTEQLVPVKVLALNGGGARGLYTVSVLARLEEVIEDKFNIQNVKIGDYFDLITGTSIGGILALGLASGKSARELQAKFEQTAPLIFPKWRFILQGWYKAFLPIYRSEPLYDAVKSMIGDNITFKDLSKRVMVPTVNLSAGCPRFFKTPHGEDFNKDLDIKLIDAALATSAAPTYFKPHKINGNYYADGGLVANNPSYIGLREVLIDMKVDFANVSIQDIKILNIGTLNENFCIGPETLKKKSHKGYFGLWGLGKRLVASTMTANQDMQKKMLIRELRHLNIEKNYIEIDRIIPNEASNDIVLDNASQHALETIKEWGSEDASTNFTQNKDLRELFISPTKPFVRKVSLNKGKAA
ncbi:MULTISPECIES: CBASS cGAMP-activated phospholipase [Acinetobacter]|uniref:CBASS cGAMP-activated phospholipase n=1 Tax=Acinetobacter TaxID=469 RepID=UPI0007079A0C|nr:MULTISPECIES: CBASS cGAMP-activated phospholipase [Acinetobacter]KQE54592.1 patatin [Acinetobacter pittii]